MQSLKQIKNQAEQEIVSQIIERLKESSYRDLPQYGSELEQIAAEKLLYQLGWRFDAEPRKDKPAYSWGWWYKPDGIRETPTRRTGDSQDAKLGAWDAYRLYEAYYA